MASKENPRSDKVTNIWDAHAAKLRDGYRVKEEVKHDLGVIDPRDQFDNAPEYQFGQLPGFYEDYMLDNMAEYGGDPAAYACAFLPMACSVLHTSVEMQTRPGKPNWRNPNEHSITLGRSGDNKSGIFKDLTKHQDEWQTAMLKASIGKKKQAVPQTMLQNGSAEGVLRQCSVNNGERILVANDEAMSFFMGTGAHHQGAGTSIMTDLVCKLYDGSSYYKALVKGSYNIPKLLGTLIMATTTDKLSGWEDFDVMITSGAMARTSVGIISHPVKRSKSMARPGAAAAMEAALLRLRGLRDCRFTLEPAAHEPWSDYIDQREDSNAAMAEARETAGLTEWCRKYDTRVMSLATVFQAIEFTNEAMDNFEPYEIPKTAEEEDKVGGGAARQGKLIQITYENLARAIEFVDGFLFRTQKYFYTIAEGVSEFGPELRNWVAARLNLHTPDGDNVITRTDLVHRGPNSIRFKGGVTEGAKAKASRWVRALLDHGYIEVYRPEGARQFRVPRLEEDEANFRIRDAFFTHFSDEATMKEFKDIYMGQQAKRDWTVSPPKLKPKGN
jgi:Protein of unknown function (DUF3987)